MGIFFNKESIKRLSADQFAALNQLADAAQAENIDEKDSNDQEEVKNYIQGLAKKEADEAERTKDLVNSFI